MRGRGGAGGGVQGGASRGGGGTVFFVYPPPPPPRPLTVSCSVKEGTNKEVLGILVSYRVKVKLVVARGGYVHSSPPPKHQPPSCPCDSPLSPPTHPLLPPGTSQWSSPSSSCTQSPLSPAPHHSHSQVSDNLGGRGGLRGLEPSETPPPHPKTLCPPQPSLRQTPLSTPTSSSLRPSE